VTTVSALVSPSCYESHLLCPFKSVAEESLFSEIMTASSHINHGEEVGVI